MPDPGDVTHCLRRLGNGEAGALDELMPLVYDDLRQVARSRLRAERGGHTLGTTALVNEAYLRLAGQRRLLPEDRGQFFASAAAMMRRVLVDYARARKRLKRGQGEPTVPLHEAEELLSENEATEMLALDLALDKLARSSPRGAEVVQHRFFSGFTLEETAQVLNVSTKTVQREWTAARAWLRKEIGRQDGLWPR